MGVTLQKVLSIFQETERVKIRAEIVKKFKNKFMLFDLISEIPRGEKRLDGTREEISAPSPSLE
ncbi:unnamed protein product [Dovyalis caffra]|uniref:Uncharacterized protein n=1 Tax=Dovyalis caffra TaxID=77055 RepID=A0AAV1SW59_9ROSI|nr:unnamed protein product [Dovyalis caffra]